MAKKHLSEDEIKYIISADSSKLQEELHTLTKDTRSLKKEEKERRNAMVELEAQGKKNSKRYANLSKECAEYSKRISENTKRISNLSHSMNVNDLTMSQLKKAARELTSTLDHLSESADPEEYARLNARLSEVRSRMSELRNAGLKVNKEFDGGVDIMNKLKLAVKAFIAVKLVGWLKSVHDQAYETRKEFAKYEAVLRNTFQSQKKAQEAMKMLQQLAADTPSSMKEWTESYIKLINRGLKPTSQELINMGDLASSQGKSVDQFLEAMLDAMTGENERLKEFGIKASKLGEKTKFSFRGVTTEVKNSQDAIKDYLLSLGKIDGIAGSMAVQMQELEGIQSNLGDTMDSFFNRIGKKLEPFWKNAMKLANDFFSAMGDLLTSYTESYDLHFEKMVQLEGTLPTLVSRYEELAGKSSRSAQEQKELASIISQIQALVPGAATAFDKYGNAISLSSEKIEEFLIKQRALLKFENQKAIKETTSQLEDYKKMYDSLIDQQKQGGKTITQTNGMFGGSSSYIDSTSMPQIEADIKKYGELIQGAEEKIKQLNGQTVEDAIMSQKKMIEARQSFNKMDKAQLNAWIKNNKDISQEYAEVAQEIYNKRFPEEDADIVKKKAEETAKAAKAALTAAEKEQKNKIAAEKKIIEDMQALRDQELDAEKHTYTMSLNAYRLMLHNKIITQEQFKIWEAAYNSNNADKRLSIEQKYAQKSKELNLECAELKEKIVKDANSRVEKAEQTSFDARLLAEETYRSNLEAMQQMMTQTSTSAAERLEVEYSTQLLLLESYYKASLEYAKENGQNEVELTEIYNQAKLSLDKKYQQDKLSLVNSTESAIRALQGNSISQEFTSIYNSIESLKSSLDHIGEEEFWKNFGENILQNMQQIANTVTSGLSHAFNAFKQIEIDNVEAKYDAEIEAAQGNQEQIERLEKEKAQKKLDIEKKYADVQFAVKASQIITNTALSIMMALGQLGPIAGPIAAGLMAATGAVQLAVANAERNKVKNMTLSSSTSGSATGARVATGRQDGGKIDVRRAQDGKFFPDSDFDPDARGFIDRPTVIVGEGPIGQSKEWVASNAAVENPTVAPILNILDKSQQAGNIRTLDLNKVIRARMAGYSSGGSISPATGPQPVATSGTGPSIPSKLMERFANAIIRIDEEGFPNANVILSDFERKQQLRDRSRRIGSK